MKLKIKRILSALLCLCMLLSLLPASALAAETDEVAVTIGGTTTNYSTLADGISALASATAEDEAVLTILKDIVINEQQNISRGVFTIDLNGCMISANSPDAISIYNEDAVVTIDDSAETGRIQSASSAITVSKSATLIVKGGTLTSEFAAIDVDNAYVTIEDVTIDSEYYGIISYESTIAVKDGTIHGGIDGIRIDYGSLTLNGGSISGASGVYATNTDTIDIKDGTVYANPNGESNYIFALYFNTCKDVRISGGSFESVGAGRNGDVADCICAYFSNLTISGGSFSAAEYDFISDSTDVINLTLNENGEGASFPGGISISETLLSEILGDGAAYWQGGCMITLESDAKEITGGDVTVKAVCTHENANPSYAPNDEEVHTVTYSCCGYTYDEEHDLDEVVTPPTCTEGGYTTYSCTLCGESYVADEVPGGHSYGDDNICTICGVEKEIEIVINMVDSYGDGWNGNAIEIYVDGELAETVTIEDSLNEETYTCTYDPDKNYEFVWSEGNYASECSFEIFISGELVASAAEGECSYYADGDTIYNTCEHVFGEETTVEATCTEGGYVYNACTLCGRKNITEELEALGHDYDANGICTRCGQDIAKTVTITMTDDYGDGWNGNGIEIYIDGEFCDTATIANGFEFTWTADYDPEKLYEFYWVKAGYAYECSFTIHLGLKKVFETSDASGLEDGELIYTTDLSENLVYVGGVELGVDQYLDLSGNVSDFEPDGGYAFYDGEVLTLNNYSYTGEGKAVEVEGYSTMYCLIYSTVKSLTIDLIGENTLQSDGDSPYVGGISLGNVASTKMGALSISGEGTLNLNVANTIAVQADRFTLHSGTVNINAFIGIYSSYNNAVVKVYDGELNITATGSHEAKAIDYAYFMPYGGKIVLSSDGDVALNVRMLEVGGGYLEVKKGGMIATESGISFHESVSVVEPEGAKRGSIEDENGNVIYTILTADGEVADAFVISDGADEPAMVGWMEIDGMWNYVDPDTYGCATGVTRVPYPTDEIGGLTYEPDQEALEYYESMGESFVNEEFAYFMFDEDGNFQADFTGILDGCYFENGMMVWNSGIIEVDGEYYYFIGNEETGANMPASGNYYVAKNNTDLDITIGGVYTFDENGKLCLYDGITEIEGKLWYYEDYQLMLGKGLVIIGGAYYYVCSDGSLVVNQTYWVEKTNGYKFTVGEYEFDENGKLVFAQAGQKHGIYFEKGGWYYYENGKKAYGKGLVSTLLQWYDESGQSIWGEGGTVYVRSDARLATGRYYISNIANYDGALDVKVGVALNFDEMGLYIAPKNGIYEVDGILRYYINGVMQYNSGVIVVDDQYYYVRSNGVVVRDCTYWITNVGSSGVIAGYYEFDENGVMQNPEFKGEAVLNGIANGYYYENGEIAYNKGLTYLDAEGCYVYVRSNGKIALGKYWITNHNNLLPAAMYDFGTDGKLYR